MDALAGLPLVGIHHDHVDQDARHPDQLRVEAAPFGEVANLGDHQSPAVVGSLRDGLRLQEGDLVGHHDVAVEVGGAALDDADVDVPRLVVQVGFTRHLDEADQVFGGRRVQLAAVDAGVDEGAEPGAGDQAGTLGRDLAVLLADDALWQVIGLDASLVGHRLHARRPRPVAADDALGHGVLGKPAEALVGAVADAGRVDQGEASGCAGVREALADAAVNQAGFDGHAAVAEHRDGVAVLDEFGCLGATHELHHRALPLCRRTRNFPRFDSDPESAFILAPGSVRCRVELP